MADHRGKEDRRPQPCDRAWHDDLSRACRARTSATSGRARHRPRITTTARASRSAGSTWSPTPAPISTRRSTAMPRASDLADLPLPSLAELAGDRRPPAVGERHRDRRRRTSKAATCAARRCWSTPAGTGTGGPTATGVDHPFLTADAADWLVENGAALVGIDSNNIDDTRVRARPVHTRLLGAGHPDLRAYDRARQPARRGLSLLRGAAESARHGHLPGARLRRARLSRARLSASRE